MHLVPCRDNAADPCSRPLGSARVRHGKDTQEDRYPGLEFSVTTIACTLAPEDSVDYVTQANTSLRYDTTERPFIQNWKTPNVPGCYIARVTNADGLLLSAIVRLR